MLGRTAKDAENEVANGNDRQGGSLVRDPAISSRQPSILDVIKARRKDIRAGKNALFSRLSALGTTHEEFITAIQQSKISGASVIQELIAQNILDAEDYYRKLAQDLGVAFVTSIHPSVILKDISNEMMESGRVFQFFGHKGTGLILLYVAPDLQAESSIIEMLESEPGQKKRIRICTPKTIVTAIEANKSESRLEWASSDLYRQNPDLSAKQVFAPWQAYVLGLFCIALPVCFYSQFVLSSLLVHIGASLLFSLVIFIRVAALRSLKKRQYVPDIKGVSSYPKYSVLIALHKEAAIASQLVRAMSMLDWPASRLEVLYVCEADDSATIEALLAHGLPGHHRIVKVPPSLPRTKPKALNFALKACTGEYIVIYDAEDRPHPLQLKEAWSRFSLSDERLACLQAPLVVTNANSSWIARMFAFEYASHFKGLLAYLAEAGVPLPLGGTSNHFRKSALEAVGGWDPYNVTEDADLGIRFYRFGYKCGVIQMPTLEDAPEIVKEWLPQRTRWQKGWMQTFLVQNRNVSRLFKILGKRNACYFEALIAGFILSPLLYIISILMALYSLYTFDPMHLAFTVVDLCLFMMGYFSATALGFECIKTETRRNKIIIALTLPVYWLLLSTAAWRAAYQLIVKPHYWEKTPHKPTVPVTPEK